MAAHASEIRTASSIHLQNNAALFTAVLHEAAALNSDTRAGESGEAAPAVLKSSDDDAVQASLEDGHLRYLTSSGLPFLFGRQRGRDGCWKSIAYTVMYVAHDVIQCKLLVGTCIYFKLIQETGRYSHQGSLRPRQEPVDRCAAKEPWELLCPF